MIGYAWSGLMFFSAALNLVVALNFSVVTWSATMSIWGIVSKAGLFLIGYAIMRTVAVARYRRREPQSGAGNNLIDAAPMQG
jgi:intracellular septation protein A